MQNKSTGIRADSSRNQDTRLGDGRFEMEKIGELCFGELSAVRRALGIPVCFSRQLANLRFVLSIPKTSESGKRHRINA